MINFVYLIIYDDCWLEFLLEFYCIELSNEDLYNLELLY